jgi:glycolate oxidase iron-sulfur subunit
LLAEQTTRELLDACVHCGFCLPSCPTYELWGEEMDSPRGRIYLMSMLERGEAEWDATTAAHLDRCLGCLACVPACPSGVRYDILIERSRAHRRAQAPAGIRRRLLEGAALRVFPRPGLLRVLAWPLAAGIRPHPLAPRLRPADLRAAPPRRTAARPPQRMTVGLLEGCVQRVVGGRVNVAAAAALAADGCQVRVPSGQGCCGALDLHAGREDAARRRAGRLVEAFEGCDRVVVTAAGCGSAMKSYGDLLGSERARTFAAGVRDVTELLAELGGSAPRAERAPLRVAYQDACHLRNGQGVIDQPRALLAAIPGVQVVEIERPERCCGSAGTYNLLEPEAARELGDRKAASILAVDPDMVATANPGCALQLAAAFRRAGRADLRIVHPVELVAEAVRD